MNLKFSGLLAGAAIIALSSCSAVYKSGQTPDDVYYSPGTAVTPAGNGSYGDGGGSEYLETNGRRGNRSAANGYSDDSYRDDQYLRMMIASGSRGYFYDDLYYNGGLGMMSPWMLNNWRFNSMLTWNSGFYSPYSSLWYWNSFYNPYYTSFYNPYYGYYGGGGGFIVGGGKGSNFNYTLPSRPSSSFTMGSYLNTNGTRNSNSYRPGRSNYGYNNNNNQPYYTPSNSRRSSYDNSNNRSFNNSNSDRPVRTYTPSSTNGGGFSSPARSSGGGGGGVSRPTRSH
ncbi:MAG: hypothetical protein QM664_01115 [Flavihumibacter sp.]